MKPEELLKLFKALPDKGAAEALAKALPPVAAPIIDIPTHMQCVPHGNALQQIGFLVRTPLFAGETFHLYFYLVDSTGNLSAATSNPPEQLPLVQLVTGSQAFCVLNVPFAASDQDYQVVLVRKNSTGNITAPNYTQRQFKLKTTCP